MLKRDVYWHFYAKSQIRPSLRGNLFYTVIVPVNIYGVEKAVTGLYINAAHGKKGFDNPNIGRIADLVLGGVHGIAYCGVSRGVREIMEEEKAELSRFELDRNSYNKEIIRRSKDLILDENIKLPLDAEPHTMMLLCGMTKYFDPAMAA